MSLERLRSIVDTSVRTLFQQIAGGRVRCESEATLQLHLGRIIATVADLAIVGEGESFSIELEKPLQGTAGRGRLDVWFRLRDEDGHNWRCAMELKFFKKKNQREPNNRYEVFKDISRLEHCGDVADVGYMLVATDHPHYVSHVEYSADTEDFDFREGSASVAGRTLSYRTTQPHGPPITLNGEYQFKWTRGSLDYLLVEVSPVVSAERSAKGLRPPTLTSA